MQKKAVRMKNKLRAHTARTIYMFQGGRHCRWWSMWFAETGTIFTFYVAYLIIFGIDIYQSSCWYSGGHSWWCASWSACWNLKSRNRSIISRSWTICASCKFHQSLLPILIPICTHLQHSTDSYKFTKREYQKFEQRKREELHDGRACKTFQPVDDGLWSFCTQLPE